MTPMAPSLRRGLMTAAGVVVAALAVHVPAAPAATVERLSHPGHASVWAFVEHAGAAYRRPTSAARKLGALKLTTEDGTAELVFVEARSVVAGRTWLRVRLPFRAGGVGWIPQGRVGALQSTHKLVIVDRGAFRLTVIRDGQRVFSARIGVGTPGAPTPRGRFYVRTRLQGFPTGSIYGPVAFGTSAKSRTLTDWPGGGVIGLHGTDEPGLLPGRVSHGCVRLRNADMLRLAGLIGVGTPVTVR